MNQRDENIFPNTGPPWKTIQRMIGNRLSIEPDTPAIIDGDVTLTRGQLDVYVSRLAENLVRDGVSRGDPVVIWSHNCWQWVASALACWSVGAVVVPVSSRLKALETMAILKRTEAKLLLTTSDCASINLPQLLFDHIEQHADECCSALPHLATIGLFEERYDREDFPIPFKSWTSLVETPVDLRCDRPRVEPDDLCEIMFTSGSTGEPKGVMLAHRQTLQIMWDAGNFWTIDDEDRILIIAPLSHVTGINAGLLAGIMRGASLVLMHTFNPAKALSQIATHNVTSVAGPPAMFEQLLTESARGDILLEGLRKISILGAPVPPSLITDLKERTRINSIFTGYGMTECSSIATTRQTDSTDIIAATVGLPMPGIQVRIAGEDDQDLTGHGSGEIQVRG